MPKNNIYADILIIGGGIAGLSAALNTGPKTKVIVLSKGDFRESATELAQGGIAAAIDEKDSPSLHLKDTLNAGAGLCNKVAVNVLVKDGVKRIKELIELGARFDQDSKGFKLTLEAAHRHRRILHAKDTTGSEIAKILASHLKDQNRVEVKHHLFVKELIVKKNKCYGAIAIDMNTKRIYKFFSKAVILTTGGIGQIYLNNTNPAFATADGIAMAYRAGAKVQDMEFLQFHPTTLATMDKKTVSLFLISESTRGEGARLYNQDGKRFMVGVHSLAELAPRDIVAREVLKQMNNYHKKYVYLDLRLIKIDIKQRFPNIYKRCKEAGFDITKERIPVAPAAHYHMGGIKTDTYGRTSIKGLYAAGEVASVGIHGANRLASNSLLDGLVFGSRAAKSALSYVKKTKIPKLAIKITAKKKEYDLKKIQKIRSTLKKIMWDKVGIIREGESLKTTLAQIEELYESIPHNIINWHLNELENMLLVAKLLTQASLDRKESRGGHFRSDFPKTNDKKFKKHLVYKK